MMDLPIRDYNLIIKLVADELELSFEIVNKTYRAYWNSIKDSIQSLPLKENLKESDFLNLQTNFNIPSLGKLTCTYPRYSRIKKRYGYLLKIRKYDKSKED